MSELILDRYEVIESLGTGGFAQVILAWDTRIQRKVALKRIKLATTGSSGSMASPVPSRSPATDVAADLASGLASDPYEEIPGLEEARTAALLHDPVIVAVYDFEIQDDYAYIIMEYIEGPTLTRFLLDHDKDLTLDIIASIFADIAHALDVAHNSGVLHLDIKPDNIIIDQSGRAKVTDFGLARLADPEGFGVATGGTIGYMPLEQMRRLELDVRCDEWALASITYEMLVGKNPFLAPDLKSAEAAIENAELILPSLCWDDLSPDADDVLFFALDPRRGERYDSIRAFADEMGPMLGNTKRGHRELAAIIEADAEAARLAEEEAAAEAEAEAANAGRDPFDPWPTAAPLSPEEIRKRRRMRVMIAVAILFLILFACGLALSGVGLPTVAACVFGAALVIVILFGVLT